jgi:hypothetical protein
MTLKDLKKTDPKFISMQKFVIICKSYRGDIDRISVLVESINVYNTDKIPFYIIVPKNDISVFKQKNFKNVNFIEDEQLYSNESKRGWIQQQIVKSSFWKLKIAENYLCVDSDNYFIRPFYLSDFMYDENIPYTVMHEQKELFSWTVGKTKELGFDPKNSYIECRDKIMRVFGRKGKIFDWGPGPVIWSSKVWESLEENYSKPNNLNFEDLIEYSESEFSWYGEALLAFKAIPIYPLEPLFRFFHYPQQYIEFKSLGYTEEMFAQNYLGFVMPSSWNAPLKY